MTDFSETASLALWQECFGDSAEYIDFFRSHHGGMRPLSLCVDGETASQLFLLDGSTVIGGTEYPSEYVFAACTAERFRSRSLMKSLIEQAANGARDRGKAFLTLVPADDGLYSYYEKLGFQKAFLRKKVTLGRDVLRCLAVGITEKTDNTDELFSIRQRELSSGDYYKWSEEHFRYCLEENEAFGGKNLCCSGAYALVKEKDDYAEVIESAGSLPLVSRMLLEDTNAALFIFTLPVDYPLSADRFCVEDCGMLLPLTTEAAEAVKRIRNAFMGLTLE